MLQLLYLEKYSMLLKHAVAIRKAQPFHPVPAVLWTHAEAKLALTSLCRGAACMGLENCSTVFLKAMAGARQV